MKIPRWITKSQKGQSFVELGVSMVILLLVLAGVIEFGMLMFQYVAMRDAAQEGAVYTSMYPTACNQTIERVKKDLYNVDPSQVEVAVEVNGISCIDARPADACASHEVKVTVRQPDYKLSMPLLGTFLGRQSLNISAATTSTIIRPPCQ